MNNSRIFRILTLSFIMVVSVLGCKKSNKTGDPIDPADENFTINVTMPSDDTSVVTRDGAANEVAIKSASVIIYADDKAATMPKFKTDIAESGITAGVGNSMILKIFKDKSIVAGDVVHVIFNKQLANLNVQQGELIEKLKLTGAGDGVVTGPFTNGLVNLSDGLPMYGKGFWVDGATNISVHRGVAKVQLQLVLSTGVNHVAGTFGKGYTTANTTFKLYQLSDAGYINAAEVSTTVSEAVSVADGGDIKHPSAQSGDNYTGANYIFAYPYAKRTIGASPISLVGNNESRFERLAMIMKNTFNGKTVYHRLDICDPSSKIYYDIVNNHHYIIKLREVSGDGYNDATTALNHPPSNVRYDVIVEDEGDVVITNGQYVLNVDTKEDYFDVAKASSKILLAKVNRVESIGAGIPAETTFEASLSGLSVSTAASALTFELGDVPVALGKEVKSLNLNVSDGGGVGMAKFRYNAKLGSIVYQSTPITLNSNFGVVYAKMAGETLTFKVSSTSAEWTVKSNASSWASPSKNGTGFTVRVSGLSSSFRTAEITVSNPAGENNQVGESIVVTITQEIELPIFADRNVGTSWDIPADDINALCLPANSKPVNPAIWATETPRRWFSVSESNTQCKNWGYQGKTWRLPTKKDFDNLVASGKLKEGHGYHKAAKLVQSDGSTVYFPLVGTTYDPNLVYSFFWSSDYGDPRSPGLRLYSGSCDVIGNVKYSGCSARCVL